MQIFPTKRQQGVLWALSNQCRWLYNWGLEARRAAWKQNQENPKRDHTKITYITQQNQLPALKKQYPNLKWVYSKVLQMTLLDAMVQHGEECRPAWRYLFSKGCPESF